MSSFLGYRPHGVPTYPAVLLRLGERGDRARHPGCAVVEDGDIVSLDFGCRVRVVHGDSAVTIASESSRTTKRSLLDGDARSAVRRRIEQMGREAALGYRPRGAVARGGGGFSVVREFVGHGIGREMHEAAADPELRAPGPGAETCAGMVFAIEPMVNIGGTGRFEVLRGRVDRGDGGRLAVRSFRAHGADHRRRARDPDAGHEGSGTRRPSRRAGS